ncbi:MAG: hypothetical protein LUG96_07835 [Tannerellaceae bacterium]|nr:hypothetical protein [Tannerellaceae bacterium]
MGSIPEIVHPDIIEGKGSIDIYKYADQKVKVEIEPFHYTTLTAQITSADPDANLHIAEIVLPDNATVGPFGRELTYELPRDGIYSLIIDENDRGGKPWSGYFTLDIELK